MRPIKILFILMLVSFPFNLNTLKPYSNFPIIKYEWEKMYKALCIIESNNNPKALNSSGAVGIIQIRPIYVYEVNRLQKIKFKLEDRFNPHKSRKMFEIFQNKYNFERNIDKAIILHIAGYSGFKKKKIPYWYLNRVKSKM